MSVSQEESPPLPRKRQRLAEDGEDVKPLPSSNCWTPLPAITLAALWFGGEADHVHLLIDIHPARDISVLVNNLKTASARRTRSRFAEHLASFYEKPLFWHRAYFVGSVGAQHWRRCGPMWMRREPKNMREKPKQR